MCSESYGGSDLTLPLPFRLNGVIEILQYPISTLLLFLEVWDVKTTSRKLYVLNIFVFSFDLLSSLQAEISLCYFIPFHLLLL